MSPQMISIPGLAPLSNVKEDWTDGEPYRRLYIRVIQLAINDYDFLRRIDPEDQLSPSERRKLRSLTGDCDPVVFFTSPWFDDICRMIGLHAQAIRERLEIP